MESCTQKTRAGLDAMVLTGELPVQSLAWPRAKIRLMSVVTDW